MQCNCLTLHACNEHSEIIFNCSKTASKSMSSYNCIIGYCEEGNNFGVVKKGKYKAASDFRFEFVAEVICEDPHSSGFMVQLTPDRPEVLPRESDCEYEDTSTSLRYILLIFIRVLHACMYYYV